jgi:thioredoxin 1
MSTILQEITPSNYQQEVLKSDKPVVVYFKTPWCGPCKQLTPIIEKMTEDNPLVKVVTIDCETHRQFVMSMGVAAVPTLQLIVNGEKLYNAIGGMVAPKLSTVFDMAVSNCNSVQSN